MFDIVTLKQIRDWLHVDGNSQDHIFEIIQKSVTKAIEEYIQKFVITRQLTEYYDGKGEIHVDLNQYPVYKVESVHDDTQRAFGADTLIPSTDYITYTEYGRVTNFKSLHRFARGHQNVKVVYWTGYSRFRAIEGENNYIDIKEGGADTFIKIPDGEYSAEDLAITIQTELNANSTLTGDYSVSYSHISQKFTIESTVNFTLLWQTGANATRKADDLTGFTSSADTAGSLKELGTVAVTGVPDDLVLAALKLAHRIYEQSKYGGNTQEKKIEPIGASGGRSSSAEYVKNAMPDEVKLILDGYRRAFI